MNVLKTGFQGADDDARQIHREVSGEPHVLPLLPHPMAPSQENTQDVISSPIISDDGQGETRGNLFSPPLLFIGFEKDLPETPEGLEWIHHGSQSSQGPYILHHQKWMDVSQASTSPQKAPDQNPEQDYAMDTPPDLPGQPSTSHQKPFTRLVNRFTPQPLTRKHAGLYMTDTRCSECDSLVELGDVGYEDALCDNCVDEATERYLGPPHADHCTEDDSAPGGPHRDE